MITIRPEGYFLVSLPQGLASCVYNRSPSFKIANRNQL